MVMNHKDFWLRYGIEPEYRYTDDEGHLLTRTQALVNTRLKYVRDQLVEVMVCSAPLFNGAGYTPLASSVPRVRKEAGSDPADIERARRRAQKRLQDLIHCNDWSYFVTVTFDGQKIDRADYSKVIKKVNTFLSNRVQRFGWKYVGVVEYHADHRGLHFHFVVAGDVRVVDSGTVLRPKKPGVKNRPVFRTTAHRQGFTDDQLTTVYNLPDWTLGFSTAIPVYGDPLALARYVGKYLTKSDSDKIGGRWFYHGGELLEPVYKYDNLDFEAFDGHLTFDTDGGTIKILYPDRMD